MDIILQRKLVWSLDFLQFIIYYSIRDDIIVFFVQITQLLTITDAKISYAHNSAWNKRFDKKFFKKNIQNGNVMK